MIAIDSNVFICLLEDNTRFGPLSRNLFWAAEKTNLSACCSALVFHEVLAYPKLTPAKAIRLQQKLEQLGIEFKPITTTTLVESARLRRQYNLGAFDSVHIASAIEARATHFVSNDQKLLTKKVSGIKLVPLSAVDTLLSPDNPT